MLGCDLLTILPVFVFGIFFFQAEDGIRDLVRSRGLGDVYKRQGVAVAIEAAKELAKEKLNAEVYVGCTVQEEMGLRLSLIHI